MFGFGRGRVEKLGLGAVVAAFLLSACAHVNQEDFDREMADLRAELRQEIQEGDQAVERRLSGQISDLETRLANLEGDLNALRDDFNVTVERLETAIRFNAPVHFAFDDATVRTQDRELLDRFAQVVRSHYSGATITVEGFTDPAGSAEYNRRLGMERAESVKEYLVRQGLASEQLRTVSYGQAPDRQVVPGARGPGEEGWQNRRVAMVIDFQPDAADRPQVASAGEDR
jgi:outer membrane protein OmpA-like peptidoglycan-associated protein